MRPESARTLAQGLVAGAIGYAVVVAFFAAFNLTTGRPVLATAAVLGRLVLGEVPTAGAIEAAPVAVYNGLHLVVFLLMGLAAAWLAYESEAHPTLWYVSLSLALFAFIHVFGAVAAFADPVREVVPLWTVLLASVLAAAAMGAYLWRSHPGLADRVRRAGDLEDPLPG